MMMSEPHPEYKLILQRMLDLFYPLFKSFISHRVYRYLAVGGVCFLINFCVFHFSYYLVCAHGNYRVLFLKPHNQSVLTSLCITLPIGFYLNRNFVFKDSMLEKNIQFFRYISSTIINAGLFAFLIDFLVTKVQWNVTLIYMFGVFVVQFFNYFIQRDISFNK
ncbi:GtrA-like protein [Pedobacter steynii]|uniref:GtrA-like protein n=1 Tax=Pedobacter steynii TaxID=430522 RepID=A0A1H0J8H2_9SPHI|nr:GtrA family protein [Pedobacter steynii]SDO39631.1 GtrA-like protein [Pedobacter steynii]